MASPSPTSRRQPGSAFSQARCAQRRRGSRLLQPPAPGRADVTFPRAPRSAPACPRPSVRSPVVLSSRLWSRALIFPAETSSSPSKLLLQWPPLPAALPPSPPPLPGCRNLTSRIGKGDAPLDSAALRPGSQGARAQGAKVPAPPGSLLGHCGPNADFRISQPQKPGSCAPASQGCEKQPPPDPSPKSRPSWGLSQSWLLSQSGRASEDSLLGSPQHQH